MRESIPLDGRDWELHGYLGVDAALAAARRAASGDRRGWIPAAVPGSVTNDVWRAGEIPDPYVDRNSLFAEWIAERAWLYRRMLARVESLGDRRAVLRFEGIDYAGEVFVDGVPVGRHEGMFTPLELDVTEQLRDGAAHLLAVVVEPAPPSEPQMGRTSRVRVHKSRMTYGWDFSPRMIHQGIWRPVSLELLDHASIVAVVARTAIAPTLDRGSVDVHVALRRSHPSPARIAAALFDGNREVARASVDVHADVAEADVALDVDGVRPWWPNGLGDPALYRLVVAVSDADGTVLDERTSTLGFRTVELAANDGAPDAARPYTFVVNGRRTYIRGWNWVPVDVMYGVPRPDRVRHLVRLARDAHVNLLRVWGGGLIEDDTFYSACDRAGIMVWQELSQSSSGFESTPASDPEFVARMVAETEAIAPTVASHPSLVAWCGGNELEDDRGPLDERHPLLAALRDTLARVDPGRIWLPTSPTGPVFGNTLETIAKQPDGLHDVHGPWEHQGLRGQQELYDRGTSLLNSEFGVEGMTNRRTLEATITPRHREPPTRDNPVYRHRGDWWINEPLVQSAFGGRLASLERVRRASQMLQADGLRYAIEANRRRAFRNSGSIPWQLNESYPNGWCTAAIDHRGDPKAAYFAVRRAYSPVHVSARFETVAWGGAPEFRANVWAWSDVEAIDRAAVRVALRGLDGAALRQGFGTVDVPVGTPVPAFDLAVERPDASLFVLDLELAALDGRLLASNRYLFSSGEDLAALVELEPASVAVDCRPRDDAWRLAIRHVDGPAAVGVTIDDDRPIDDPGWAEASDGNLILLPGEHRDVDVRWANAPVDGRRVAVSGWNVDAIAVA